MSETSVINTITYTNKGNKIVRQYICECPVCKMLEDEPDIYDWNDGEPIV